MSREWGSLVLAPSQVLESKMFVCVPCRVYAVGVSTNLGFVSESRLRELASGTSRSFYNVFNDFDMLQGMIHQDICNLPGNLRR